MSANERPDVLGLIRETNSLVRDESEIRFPGRSHGEVLALKVEAKPQLVDGIVERGTIGTVAGLPETYKSWLGQALALKVATGGTFLGRQVMTTGAVGYWWQDDSEENEARRIQAYTGRHALTDPLTAVRWYLNEGLRLPDDLAGLRAEIDRERQVLVVLDSLYNFLGGVRLKDEEVAEVYAQLKREVCDLTGCAVCIIDHAPWPTEGNQGQRRAYGSVFKAAAIRWGIYVEQTGGTHFIEARGNNVTGLPRTPALWDADRLELRVIEAPDHTDDLGGRIDDFLRRNPGAATTVITAGVTGDDKLIRERLQADDRFTKVPPKLFGRPSNAVCWARTEDVPNLINSTSVEDPTEVAPTLPRETDSTSVGHPSTYEVGGGRTDVGSPPR